MKSIGRALDEYLQTVGTFNWETNNCCQYALGWLKFRGSPDHVPGYDNLGRLEVARMLRDHGGLGSLCSFFLDRDPAPVTQLQIGDLVLVTASESGQSLAILAGRTAAVLTLTGVGHDRITPDLTGWKIK